MLNKYENLIKIYYKKRNIEEEYIKRIENPSTFIINLKINPIKRGNKILDKEYNLFYGNLFGFEREVILILFSKISCCNKVCSIKFT